MRTRDLGFLLAFSTALLPAGAWQLMRFGVPPGLAAWFPVGFIFGLVPWIDALCGDERRNEDDAAAVTRLEHAHYFPMLTALVVPVWLGLLAWCTARFAALDSLPAQLGWLVSTGVIGGVLAINPAHELIHKSTRWE
ncbi:MAG: alkane 1-monooxygenase, partial [Dyella sp.]